MTVQPGGGKDVLLKKKMGGWLAKLVFQPGWPQWVLLAVAVIVFILSALMLTGGTDYREDPSALAPRSSDVYVETKDLVSLLKKVSTWRLWKEDRRSSVEEDRNQLQVDIAGLLSDQVTGLNTSSPSRWLASTSHAAYCHSTDAEQGGAWALFLKLPDPTDVLAEIEMERGMNLEAVRGTRDNGVFKLTGTGDGELFFGVVKPWLIISSQARLPEFAMDSVRKPALSLGGTGVLPGWKSGSALRGMYNPAYTADKTDLTAYSVMTAWMTPDIRINFLSRIGRNGFETTFNAAPIGEKVRGGGVLWPLFLILAALVALLALITAFSILLVMVGWGGWLKSRAIRAGIIQADGPENVGPSQAFREDAGVAKAPGHAAPISESGPAEKAAPIGQDVSSLSDSVPNNPSASSDGISDSAIGSGVDSKKSESQLKENTIDSDSSSQEATHPSDNNAQATGNNATESESGIKESDSGEESDSNRRHGSDTNGSMN